MMGVNCCIDCGRIISTRGTRCKSCATKGSRNPMYGKSMSNVGKTTISVVTTKRHLESRKEELRSRDWLYNKYVKNELSSRDIAKILGVGKTAVLGALKREGIDVRTSIRGKEAKYKKLYDGKLYDKEWLEYKYLNEDLSLEEIGNLLGAEAMSVFKALKRMGIPTRNHTEAHKGRHSAMYGKHHTEKTKNIIGAKAKERNTDEFRAETSKRFKELWQRPDFIKAAMKRMHAKPNKLESDVDIALQDICSKDYAYNGDFSCGVTIGGMIPDFVNVNGKKVVIEVFGDAFHDPSKAFVDVSWKRQEFGRKAVYAQFGFDCIILWESDLRKGDMKSYILSRFEEEGVEINER